MRKGCVVECNKYPNQATVSRFKETQLGLEVNENTIAAWSGGKIRGLFIKKGYKMRKWSIK